MYLRRLIIGYLSLGALSGLSVYIFGWDILVNIWSLILGYSVILYILHVIWRKIRYKKILSYMHYFALFLYRISVLGTIIFIVGVGFSVYQNILFPAQLPYYLLSNGTHTLHFQTMSHIASPEFYKQVRDDIRSQKKDGYILYYEGVRPGTQENIEAFNTALGFKIDAQTYDKLSELYGIIAQDNEFFLNLENSKDYNIDLSIDEIMEIYRNKFPENGENSGILNNSVGDIDTLIDETLSDISPRELQFLRFMNQAFMNMIIKNEYIRHTILTLVGNDDIFGVILDDRNSHLVEEIYEKPNEDIFIIYGLMHFQGVYDLLLERDANWEIIKMGEYKVINAKW